MVLTVTWTEGHILLVPATFFPQESNHFQWAEEQRAHSKRRKTYSCAQHHRPLRSRHGHSSCWVLNNNWRNSNGVANLHPRVASSSYLEVHGWHWVISILWGWVLCSCLRRLSFQHGSAVMELQCFYLMAILEIIDKHCIVYLYFSRKSLHSKWSAAQNPGSENSLT